MEEILIKLSITIICFIIYSLQYLTAFIIIQFLVYRITGISIINKLLKLVAKCATYEMGGK